MVITVRKLKNLSRTWSRTMTDDRNYKVSGKKMLPKKGNREGYYAKKLRRIEEREASKQEKADV